MQGPLPISDNFNLPTLQLPRVYPILDSEALARRGIAVETAAAAFLEGGAGILHVGHGRVALADVLAWTGEGFRAVERGKPIEFALIDCKAACRRLAS